MSGEKTSTHVFKLDSRQCVHTVGQSKSPHQLQIELQPIWSYLYIYIERYTILDNKRLTQETHSLDWPQRIDTRDYGLTVFFQINNHFNLFGQFIEEGNSRIFFSFLLCSLCTIGVVTMNSTEYETRLSVCELVLFIIVILRSALFRSFLFFLRIYTPMW